MMCESRDPNKYDCIFHYECCANVKPTCANPFPEYDEDTHCEEGCAPHCDEGLLFSEKDRICKDAKLCIDSFQSESPTEAPVETTQTTTTLRPGTATEYISEETDAPDVTASAATTELVTEATTPATAGTVGTAGTAGTAATAPTVATAGTVPTVATEKTAGTVPTNPTVTTGAAETLATATLATDAVTETTLAKEVRATDATTAATTAATTKATTLSTKPTVTPEEDDDGINK